MCNIFVDWHFPGRDTCLASVIETWERELERKKTILPVFIYLFIFYLKKAAKSLCSVSDWDLSPISIDYIT